MQNQRNSGWSDGFVPVNGSWDFNMDRCTRCNASQTADTADAACEQNIRVRNAESCACNGQTARPACANANQGVGMVSTVMQTLDEVYASPKALRAGTLFPELNMSLNGYSTNAASCGDAAQANAFAAWELRLFLNTHPNDREAMKLFRRLSEQAGDDTYATAFLGEQGCANAWGWVNAPWPWEYDAQCGC